MAHRHDPKERRPFGTTGTQVANALLSVIGKRASWKDIERGIKAQLDITNWSIEVRQPLQWLVANGFVKEVEPEVYACVSS